MVRRTGFRVYEFGDRTLLIPTQSRMKEMNGIVVLNETGALIWRLLRRDCTVEEVVTAISREFDADEQHIVSDVNTFIGDLTRLGLLAA